MLDIFTLKIFSSLTLTVYNQIKPKNPYYFFILGSDGHKSTYQIKWVVDTWTRNKIQIEPYTCFGEELEKLTSKVSYNDLSLKEGQKELIKSILKYGIGIVTNASNIITF